MRMLSAIFIGILALVAVCGCFTQGEPELENKRKFQAYEGLSDRELTYVTATMEERKEMIQDADPDEALALYMLHRAVAQAAGSGDAWMLLPHAGQLAGPIVSRLYQDGSVATDVLHLLQLMNRLQERGSHHFRDLPEVVAAIDDALCRVRKQSPIEKWLLEEANAVLGVSSVEPLPSCGTD